MVGGHEHFWVALDLVAVVGCCVMWGFPEKQNQLWIMVPICVCGTQRDDAVCVCTP